MEALELLRPHDMTVAHTLMEAAYAQMPTVSPLAASIRGGDLTPFELSRLPVCFSASDLVTRTAHRMGIMASREIHNSHAITSFGPADALPSEDDLIMCLTWGQYLRSHVHAKTVDSMFTRSHPGYFGLRKHVLVTLPMSPSYYAREYESSSVARRQVTHSSERQNILDATAWLPTSPAAVQTGNYPIGKVQYTAYPKSVWNAAILDS